jgi:hypothetical protein
MRTLAFVIVLAIVVLAVASGALAASRTTCSACETGVLESMGFCSYSTIQCWCEAWPNWVCCIRRACVPEPMTGLCTICWNHEECFTWPCGTTYPESTGGVRLPVRSQ